MWEGSEMHRAAIKSKIARFAALELSKEKGGA